MYIFFLSLYFNIAWYDHVMKSDTAGVRKRDTFVFTLTFKSPSLYSPCLIEAMGVRETDTPPFNSGTQNTSALN